jgi:hypothetical protein
MALTLAQAEQEYDGARQRLRETLVKVQTYRIDRTLDADVPDVSIDVAWLLANGRHRIVARLMEQVEQYLDATANLHYAQSEPAREYEAVVAAGEPDYLPGSP